MKTRKWGIVVLLCIFSVMASACSIGSKAPVLTYDGSFQLTVGKTPVGDALAAGFTGSHSLPDKIAAGEYENLYAYKDGLYYGAMRAGNKTSQRIDFEKGVVFEISLDYDDPSKTVGEVLINGVNYENYTREQVKEAMGTDNITMDTDKYLVYEIGKYKYTFRFEDGSKVVTSITINDGTKTTLVFN